MVNNRLSGPTTPGELERLAQSYASEAAAEETLAASLKAQAGLEQAADNNRRRALRHRRTAEILGSYAQYMTASEPHPHYSAGAE